VFRREKFWLWQGSETCDVRIGLRREKNIRQNRAGERFGFVRRQAKSGEFRGLSERKAPRHTGLLAERFQSLSAAGSRCAIVCR